MPLRPHTPPRPWCPLSDAEWLALYPHLIHRSPAGRQVGDLRARMDAIFHIACTASPWRDTPEKFGKPDTIARYFRRLTHGGLWQSLLETLVALDDDDHPLRRIESFITRACRRAHRILGLGFLVLIRRLSIRSALNGPPWLLPDPDLSERLMRYFWPAIERRDMPAIRLLKRLLRTTAGKKSIPRSVRLAWP
ncbi:transposase [Humitalea sp. 24SJ18S-53]|uniref:transposase n=1 Tax=Humitalea sp. 24SJ18S-53 TaxID=3422307 RepID=UPI003D67FEF8